MNFMLESSCNLSIIPNEYSILQQRNLSLFPAAHQEREEEHHRTWQSQSEEDDEVRWIHETSKSRTVWFLSALLTVLGSTVN